MREDQHVWLTTAPGPWQTERRPPALLPCLTCAGHLLFPAPAGLVHNLRQNHRVGTRRRPGWTQRILQDQQRLWGVSRHRGCPGSDPGAKGLAGHRASRRVRYSLDWCGWAGRAPEHQGQMPSLTPKTPPNSPFLVLPRRTPHLAMCNPEGGTDPLKRQRKSRIPSAALCPQRQRT